MNPKPLAMVIASLLAACSTTTAPPPSASSPTTNAPAAPGAPAAPAAQAVPATAAAVPGAAAASGEKPRIVRSRDGSYDGEMVGTPAPGSLFGKMQIGMTGDEVVKLMGRPPARSHTYETGKRWIPLYFGNDVVRLQALYEGEGCLIYATANRFMRTTPDLIRIEFDPSGKCYRP